MTRLLDGISGPADLKKLPISDLPQLAGEIRERIVEVVGNNGGHLASNLGVTELTIALHYCFDFKTDRLVWDVGHQCYPHKLLTGRNKIFHTLRKSGGVSGFPSTDETDYDLFNVGHAGTAIATAVGLARGDEMMGRDAHVVALVGDASIGNGVAFEGLNQAGLLKRQLLIILNDNEWGIAPTQGSLAEYLAKFRVSGLYEEVKDKAKKYLPRVPVVGKPVFEALDHLKEGFKATVSPHQIFEQLGFVYVGPTDGHDICHLIELLNHLKEVKHPVLLHAHTEKGKGYDWACRDPGTYHSPKPFRIEGAKVTIQTGSGKSWTSAFADVLIDAARGNEKIFAFTAAMPDGTGIAKFMEVYPDRALDIGIAESCCVDVAAGMAKSGLRPVCAIYSTFLQRAFDQVFQEVVLQNLPVMFCIDRAGLVGGDGPVHHGFLDITYLRAYPNMVLMAPADEAELAEAMALGLRLNGPCAIRYPRDNVPESMGACPAFELGKSRLMREGQDVTLLAYGATVAHALDAAELLADDGIEARVINARFAKPMDGEMISDALSENQPVLTIEDHSVAGGFGSAVLEAAQTLGLPTQKMVRLGMPENRFIAHGSRPAQLAEVGIDAAGIAAAAQRALADPPRQSFPDSSDVLAEPL